MDWRSVKLRPRSSVAVVAIAKAAVSPLAMAGNRVDGPSLLATVRLDRIFTADCENAYLSSVNFHGG